MVEFEVRMEEEMTTEVRNIYAHGSLASGTLVIVVVSTILVNKTTTLNKVLDNDVMLCYRRTYPTDSTLRQGDRDVVCRQYIIIKE